MSSLNVHSLTSIQKTKNKRTVLPKTSLIQVFLDTDSSANNPADRANHRSKILPKFTNQQLIHQFNLTANNQYNGEVSSTSVDVKTLITQNKPNLQTSPNVNNANQRKLSLPVASNITNSVPTTAKEKKFKELTRLCINDHSEFEDNINNQTDNFNINLNNINQCLSNAAVSNIQLKNSNKQNLINYLARDFFLDCKQRLDLSTFKCLLTLLGEFKTSQTNDLDSQRQLLNAIHELIRTDTNLCNKFAAFLTCERALAFNLLAQSIQYEKCYEFFHKLDLLMPNRCSFKKLLQFTVMVASSDGAETDTLASKCEEIKNRIRTLTKNNPLINLELEYLFDQRFVNLEPVYERVALGDFDADKLENVDINEDLCSFLNSEHIDLTHVNNLAGNVSKVKVNIAAKFGKFKPVTGKYSKK